MKHRLLMGLAALAITLPFQNCSPLQPASTDASEASKTIGASNGNGQPYDGKLYDGKSYIVSDTCPDGTIVNSRLVVKGDEASLGGTLYRDNCQTSTPRNILPGEIKSDPKNPDQLIYNGRTFAGERPAIPLPGMISWYYQLQGPLPSRPAGIYIIDMFDTMTSEIKKLKDAGHTVICTISAGTIENNRPDTAQFKAADIGKRVSGGGSERWLDTRSTNVRSIMMSRLDLAKNKGCHGIDFDSVDGYDNSTGFPLTSATQLEYNQYLAFAAHDRNLILALNNAPQLASELSIQFDFAIAEQCFEFDECEQYASFVKRGKPVLAAEYSAFSSSQCSNAKNISFSLVYLSPELDGSRYESCF